MDRSHLESSRRMYGSVARMHQLLCDADGIPLGTNGARKVLRRDSKVGRASEVERSGKDGLGRPGDSKKMEDR